MSLMLIVVKLRISATDRIVLKLSKLEFKSTRRKKIYFGNEFTVLRTFARNFSNIDFFLKLLPLKDDELAMSEM